MARRGRDDLTRRLRGLKLRDLHILSVAASLGSMAKSASELGMSQPAVSEAVVRLETAIGARLLDRTSRGVEPTSFGAALLQRAQVAFDELRLGLLDVETLADPTTGEIRIGCPESLAAGFVPAVLQRLARRSPKIRVHVSLAQPGEQHFRELRERKVDLLIGRLFKPVEETDIGVDRLCDDAFFVVTGGDNRWASRRKLSLSDLINEPWILFPADSLSGKYIQQGFWAAGPEMPRNVTTSFSIQLRLHLLSTGRYLTVLHGSVLEFNAARWGLKVLPADFRCPPMPIVLFTTRHRTQTAALQRFVEEAHRVACQMKLVQRG